MNRDASGCIGELTRQSYLKYEYNRAPGYAAASALVLNRNWTHSTILLLAALAVAFSGYFGSLFAPRPWQRLPVQSLSIPQSGGQPTLERGDFLAKPALPVTERSPDSIGGSQEADGLVPAVGGESLSSQGAIATQEANNSRRSITEYQVQPGDTVSGLAQRFGISTATIVWSNDLPSPDLLTVGDTLKILPFSGVLHKIGSGDTLGFIANLYGAKMADIVEANGLASADLLTVGQELIVPGGEPPTGSRQAPIVTGRFIWPTYGVITTYFSAAHRGIDIANRFGTPIAAVDGGQVVEAVRLDWGLGWYIVIDHGNGLKTVYAHMSKFLVSPGEWVSKGETIGLIGSTGYSTGPHLHLEVIKDGARLNPFNYLP